MITMDVVIFYSVFILQIFTLSYYIPQQLLKRMAYVTDNFSPEEYPKFYPKPKELYLIGQLIYRRVNQAIALIGIIVLFLLVYAQPVNLTSNEAIPLVFGLLQFMPLLFLEISQYNHLKAMRTMNMTSKRLGELKARSIFNHISPYLLFCALAAFVLFLGLDLYWNKFDLSFSGETFIRCATLVFMNIWFALIIYFQLYGKKADPYQSSSDRFNQNTFVIKSQIYGSIAASVFFIFSAAEDVFIIDPFEAAIASIYFQTIGLIFIFSLLHTIPIKDINFDVYKKQQV